MCGRLAMLFNSFNYLLFLPIVVAVYWLIGQRFRPIWLLLASYYFYMAWFAKYGFLLGILTLTNYLIALIIANNQLNKVQRKATFGFGLAINLGCLLFFKYTNFLLASCWQIIEGVFHCFTLNYCYDQLPPHLYILLPLGISFFVFEFIHYLTDVFRGSCPIRNPIHFGLFAAFFPSQIAGPIKRYQDFDAQVLTGSPFNPSLFQTGCWLILEGMFKRLFWETIWR